LALWTVRKINEPVIVVVAAVIGLALYPLVKG
jgi:hypothetical protein